MDRRELLKRAGLGAVALGSLPLFAANASADDEEAGFHFLVLSAVPNTPERLIITGDGTFGSKPEGGGFFDHFSAVGSPPLPLVATGTWEAEEVISWTPLGTHGVFQAGILVLRATFRPIGQKPVRNVTVEIDCNLGPAGASTGKEEGVITILPTSPPTVFEPVNPTVGVTIFTTANEPDDD